MTDIEALTRYIKAFDVGIPEFTDEAFWNKLRNGTQWMINKFPESPFIELAEKYEHDIYELSLIREEIIKEGGKHINGLNQHD